MRTPFFKSQITSSILTLALAASGLAPALQVRAESRETLKDKAAGVSRILEDAMQDQYDAAVSEIEERVKEEGLDYSYSMHSFEEEGNPFKDMDYISLIADYAAVAAKAQEDGKECPVDLQSLPFLTWDGEIKETPEEDGGSIRYLFVTLDVLEPDDVFSLAGAKYDTEEVRADAERRKAIIAGGGKEEADTANALIRSGLFLTLPEDTVNSGDWTEEFTALFPDGGMISMDGESIVRIAESLVGRVPYEWGGKASMPGYDDSWWTYDYAAGTQKGLDCSGFVQWVYMTAGADPSVYGQLLSTGTMEASDLPRVSEEDLQPGDVGFYNTGSGHCGIYAGDGMWVHCSSSRKTVAVTKFDGFTQFLRPLREDAPIETRYEVQAAYTGEDLPVIGNALVLRAGEKSTRAADDDVLLLAKLISHEAENQGLNGWIAVGEVVKNRVASSLFPDTVPEVIYQEGQFTDAEELSDITPGQEIIDTARGVLEGRYSVLDNPSCLYYRNAYGEEGNWGPYPFYEKIGDHSFYLQNLEETDGQEDPPESAAVDAGTQAMSREPDMIHTPNYKSRWF